MFSELVQFLTRSQTVSDPDPDNELGNNISLVTRRSISAPKVWWIMPPERPLIDTLELDKLKLDRWTNGATWAFPELLSELKIFREDHIGFWFYWISHFGHKKKFAWADEEILFMCGLNWLVKSSLRCQVKTKHKGMCQYWTLDPSYIITVALPIKWDYFKLWAQIHLGAWPYWKQVYMVFSCW